MKIKTLSIEELCNIEYGTRVTRKKDGGKTYPVYGGGGETFFLDKTNRNNRVVISRFAMSEKCTRFVKGNFFLNDSGLTLSPKNNNLSKEYLNLIILGLNDLIYDMGRGTAQRNLDMKKFRLLKISYPNSLSEQQSIVIKLNAVIDEINKINSNNTLINKNLDSIINKFTNLNFNSIVEKKPLDSLCNFLNGYAFKSKETVDISNVQLLRMGNLYNNKLDLERKSVFYPEKFSSYYSKFVLSPGDIVMTLTGTVGKRDYGYALEIPETKIKLLLNQRILKLYNFKSNIVNKKYLLFYLNSQIFLNSLFKTANGTRQANLSSEIIKKMKIPLPSMDNQLKILEKLKLLNQNNKVLLENLEKKSQLLGSLKSSLMKNIIKNKAA